MIYTFLPIVCAAIIIVQGWRTTRKVVHGMPLPPGPRLLPFVGNALSIDFTHPMSTYAKWGKQFGDLVYARFLGVGFIVINSERAARNIVDKRGAIYADRPDLPMIDYYGLSFISSILPNCDEHRLQRRLFHTALRVDALPSYHDLHLRKAHECIVSLLDATKDYAAHFDRFASAINMAATYGYEAKPKDDPFIMTVKRFVDVANHSLRPEVWVMLKLIPFVLRLPSFMPGSGYKKQAEKCRRLAKEVLEEPFQYTQKQIAEGIASTSLVSGLLSQADQGKGIAHEQSIKAFAATVYIAGSDTISSTLQVFVLAMLLYPEVQARARAEIDTVCEREKLPTFHDRKSLPYIEAVCREILRWEPVAPLGFPHATTEDDVYNGCFIPKGTIVIMNAWAMSKDEDVYSDPSRFSPDRHFTADGSLKDEPTQTHFAFGFGRRICAGRALALDVVWASVVSILSTVEIAPAKDDDGKNINVIPDFTIGVAIHPKPFQFSMRSVSPIREEQIRMM